MTRQVPTSAPRRDPRRGIPGANGITAYRLAKAIHVPQTRVAAIIAGTRGITADTGLRLARAFGASDEFWMNLQRDYDAAQARDALGDELNEIGSLTA